jgi:hypothetical protein
MLVGNPKLASGVNAALSGAESFRMAQKDGA